MVPRCVAQLDARIILQSSLERRKHFIDLVVVCGIGSAMTRPSNKMPSATISMEVINGLDPYGFVARLGFLFEGSPWIVARAWHARPFASFEHLHRAFLEVLSKASADEKVALIQAHPDLAGRAARGPQSAREQSSAGLDRLSPEEIATFERLNQTYKDRFGFPFVVCARENTKDTILEGFVSRLSNSRSAEIETALREIARIAYLRMLEVVTAETQRMSETTDDDR